MIGIVDYGMGNLRSVLNGFRKIGARAKIISNEQEIEEADGIVLPGVGAFGDGMRNLSPIKDALVDSMRKKPFLGICLGMQLMFEESMESAEEKGFCLFPGRVRRFSGVRTPHMGWNGFKKVMECPLLKGMESGYVYFMHSYYVEQNGLTAAVTDYGASFSSIVCKDNVFLVQFHPEKSGEIGLRMLKNFVEMVE